MPDMDAPLYPQGLRGVRPRYDSAGDFVMLGDSNLELLRIDPATGLVKPAKITTGAGPILQEIRTRVSAADVSDGYTLLPALAGFKYRIVDFDLVAIGADVADATTVDIGGTQSTAVKLFACDIGVLTRSRVVKPNTTVAGSPASVVTVLADGASYVACDADTAITIGVTGSDISGASDIDVVLSYAVEAA